MYYYYCDLLMTLSKSRPSKHTLKLLNWFLNVLRLLNVTLHMHIYTHVCMRIHAFVYQFNLHKLADGYKHFEVLLL